MLAELPELTLAGVSMTKFNFFFLASFGDVIAIIPRKISKIKYKSFCYGILETHSAAMYTNLDGKSRPVLLTCADNNINNNGHFLYYFQS